MPEGSETGIFMSYFYTYPGCTPPPIRRQGAASQGAEPTFQAYTSHARYQRSPRVQGLCNSFRWSTENVDPHSATLHR